MPASARILEIALWFHDAGYDPNAGDSEEQSAELALRTLRDTSVPGRLVTRMCSLLLESRY